MTRVSPEKWQRLEKLFAGAFGLPTEARGEFVRAACAGDSEILSEAELLIDADVRCGRGILDLPWNEWVGELFEDSAAAADHERTLGVGEGLRVGPYRLLQELGRGGMATVHLAERVDGKSEQRVALKLIQRGMDTESAVQHFLREREILSSLHHPNIVRLLDSGDSCDGRPYFAMEAIGGLPFTRHCDARRLDIPERVGLFLGVCEAVRHAHQNAVIHCDLKPSNVLVAPEGRVKLLDFGIATVLGPEAAEGNTLQWAGWKFMTLEYAAPEQLRSRRVAPTTDVYSLAVMLYELLTGHRPYRLSGLGPDAIMSVVCDIDPRRPSTRVEETEEIRHSHGSTEVVTPEIVAGVRHMAPCGLRQTLAGDLDDIILKGMAKEPKRRYPSVEALAGDLRDYLSRCAIVQKGKRAAAGATAYRRSPSRLDLPKRRGGRRLL